VLRRHIPVPAVSGYYVALTVWSNHDEDSFFFTIFSCTSPSNDYFLYNSENFDSLGHTDVYGAELECEFN